MLSTTLQPGAILKSDQVGEITIGDWLGAGAQGDVFKATLTDGSPKAVKWYFGHMATPEQLSNLRQVVEASSRIDRGRLVWPEALLESATGATGFGYVMDLRPDGFEPLSKVIKGRVSVKDRELLRAAINLVLAYKSVYSAGLAYRDIKAPNVFISPSDGRVLVLDNDNCVPVDQPSEILGTMDYCAPELLTGKSNAPGRLSDLHSLSILLFMMLVRGHPLDGVREESIMSFDEDAKIGLYGRNPVFVFDPDNDQNRPAPGRHDSVVKHWSLWPTVLTKTWITALTTGLREPEKRPTLGEWTTALLATHDGMFRCSACDARNFYDRSSLQGQAQVCNSCSQASALPARIRIGESIVLSDEGSALYEHHTKDGSASPDFSTPILEYSTKPGDPSMVGLKNATGSSMTAQRKDGSMTTLEPGRSIKLSSGLRINLGPEWIEVRM